MMIDVLAIKIFDFLDHFGVPVKRIRMSGELNTGWNQDGMLGYLSIAQRLDKQGSDQVP